MGPSVDDTVQGHWYHKDYSAPVNTYEHLIVHPSPSDCTKFPHFVTNSGRISGDQSKKSSSISAAQPQGQLAGISTRTTTNAPFTGKRTVSKKSFPRSDPKRKFPQQATMQSKRVRREAYSSSSTQSSTSLSSSLHFPTCPTDATSLLSEKKSECSVSCSDWDSGGGGGDGGGDFNFTEEPKLCSPPVPSLQSLFRGSSSACPSNWLTTNKATTRRASSRKYVWKKTRLDLARKYRTDQASSPGKQRVTALKAPREFNLVTGVDIAVRKLALVTRHIDKDKVLFHTSLDLFEETLLLVCHRRTTATVKGLFHSFLKKWSKLVSKIRRENPHLSNERDVKLIALNTLPVDILTRMERIHLMRAILYKYRATFFHPSAFIVVESQMHEPHVSLQFILCSMLASRCDILPSISVKVLFGLDNKTVRDRFSQSRGHRASQEGKDDASLYRIRKQMAVEKAVLGYKETWLTENYSAAYIADPAEACLFTKFVTVFTERRQSTIRDHFVLDLT